MGCFESYESGSPEELTIQREKSMYLRNYTCSEYKNAFFYKSSECRTTKVITCTRAQFEKGMKDLYSTEDGEQFEERYNYIIGRESAEDKTLRETAQNRLLFAFKIPGTELDPTVTYDF